MVTKTTNLKLNKPDGKDVVDISVLNANMDILDEAVPSKVDKVAGKQLSTEDYTTAEKSKLVSIAEGAQVNVIDTIIVNGSAIPTTNRVARLTIPTKVGDLTNDAGYAKTADLPTKVGDLTNDVGFITKAVADLANYYVKTDTYTRSEVLELVNAIPKFTVTVVNELPASGDQATIYFVPVEGKGQNVHDEYIWVNGAWEQIGSTAFELDIVQDASGIKINGTALQGASATQDGLLTKEAYNTFAGKQDAGDYATTQALTTGLAKKQDAGSYATTDALTKGLAGKQNTGDYALRSEIPDISGKADKSEIPDISGKLDKSGGTMTGPLNINGGDGKGINIPQDGTINGPGTATLFGFLSNVFTVGSGTWPTNIRGQGARPEYNNADLAMLADVPDVSNKADKSEIPDISGLATKTELTNGLAGKQPTGDYAYRSEIPSIAGLATEEYVNGKVSSVYRVMGSCTTAQLASKAKTKGDVWNLTDAGQYGPIGTNVVYTGAEWDALGGTIDLSGYATKGEVQTAQNKADSAYNLANGKADASALTGYVPTSRTINNKALTSNISLGASDVGALPSNGKANTAGTADKAISDGQGRNIVNTYATKSEVPDTANFATTAQVSAIKPAFSANRSNELILNVNGKTTKKKLNEPTNTGFDITDKPNVRVNYNQGLYIKILGEDYSVKYEEKLSTTSISALISKVSEMVDGDYLFFKGSFEIDQSNNYETTYDMADVAVIQKTPLLKTSYTQAYYETPQGNIGRIIMPGVGFGRWRVEDAYSDCFITGAVFHDGNLYLQICFYDGAKWIN